MRKRFGILLLVLMVLLVGVTAAQPKRWPEPVLHAWLLRKTPLGSHETRVRGFLDARGWRGHSYREDRGFYKQFVGKPGVVIGVRSMRADLGQYGSPLFLFLFDTYTTVFYGFDAQGQLIDVWVWKSTDTL